MKELQGAIIIASAFQALLGYTGLMTLLLRSTTSLHLHLHLFHKLYIIIYNIIIHKFNKKTILTSTLFRLINPVVVSPTIAAVGLSFYTYGFPHLGECLEIGILQILIVIIFFLVSLFIFHISFSNLHKVNKYSFFLLFQYLRKVSLFGHRVFLIYAVSKRLFFIFFKFHILKSSFFFNIFFCLKGTIGNGYNMGNHIHSDRNRGIQI